MASRPVIVLLGLSLGCVGCERSTLLGEPADIWAPAERLSLRVTLEDDAGQALEGAWVILDPTGRDRLTDSSGLASFYSLDPGSYDIAGAAQGFELGHAEATLDSEDIDLTLALVPRQFEGVAR